MISKKMVANIYVLGARVLNQGKEFVCRTNPIDRTLRWQRPDAATQRPVDSREVQIL